MAGEKRRAAEKDLEATIQLLDPIVRAQPRMARARSMMGRAKGTLGRLLLERGAEGPARPLLQQAVELQKKCLEENEASPRDRKALRDHEEALLRAKPRPSP
jgi:hypothetical protein